MSRFINPFTDYGFKKIFGQEVTKDLLIDFLNDLLVGEHEIHDLQFLSNEQLPEYSMGRTIIYDVYCKTSTGEYIIVEMQSYAQKNFKERALYYLSRTIVNQAKRGDWEFDIKAVYGVFLMTNRANENQKFRTDVILSDRDSGELFSNKMRQIFINLNYFNKEEHECETDFERWTYILKNMDTLKRMPFKAQKEVFRKLEEIVDVTALSPEDREKYDQSVKVYRDVLVTRAAAVEEGEKKGLEKGKIEGKIEGRIEGKIEMARNLKTAGVAIEIIAASSGLSAEEIEKL